MVREGPGDNSRPGVYCLSHIHSPGVNLDPAYKRSYTVYIYIYIYARSYARSIVYRRSGFDCEILLLRIASFSIIRNQKNRRKKNTQLIIIILPAWQFTIIKITIWLVQRHSQSFNYAIKTRPTCTVYAHAIRANERCNDAYACIYN